MKKEIHKADLLHAVDTLGHTERGRQTLRDLLTFIGNGGDGLDTVNQAAVFTILACQFGPFAGSTREEIKRVVKPAPVEKAETFDESELATVLVALRFWQEMNPLAHKNENEIPRRFRDFFIDCAPLSPVEIDELCERLNLS